MEQKERQNDKNIDRRRDRTCNLLIRSQAPCHWASRPCYGQLCGNVRYKRILVGHAYARLDPPIAHVTLNELLQTCDLPNQGL